MRLRMRTWSTWHPWGHHTRNHTLHWPWHESPMHLLRKGHARLRSASWHALSTRMSRCHTVSSGMHCHPGRMSYEWRLSHTGHGNFEERASRTSSNRPFINTVLSEANVLIDVCNMVSVFLLCPVSPDNGSKILPDHPLLCKRRSRIVGNCQCIRRVCLKKPQERVLKAPEA